MSNIVVIREVTGYESPKCDLSEKEMEMYKAMKRDIYARFKELCADVDDIRSYEEEHHIQCEEKKQMVADAFCLALQMTSAAGSSNHVSEMRYEKLDNGDEIVTPVLADGNDEWYKCHVTGDSGIAMIMDMVNQFVRKAW